MIVKLKRRAFERRIPVVYVNDNFGQWRSEIRADICLLLSAQDANVFGYQITVPEGCVASVKPEAKAVRHKFNEKVFQDKIGCGKKSPLRL